MIIYALTDIKPPLVKFFSKNTEKITANRRMISIGRDYEYKE